MLEPFTPDKFHILHNWVTDADMLFRFAGTDFSFPLTSGQLEAYQLKFPDRQLYFGLKEGEYYAFGEIIPQEGNVPRLGRLLVGKPEQRGKGLGVLFVKELTEYCRKKYDSPAVELYVNANNAQAIRCYEKNGFTFLREDILLLHQGTTHTIKKMRLTF